jgi:CheY-like chemotaxis protein
VRQQLETKSYAVSVVYDGEAAQQAILDGKFDLVILDVNLPKLDGVSLLQRMRPSLPRLPVLVLTARNRVEDRALSLDTGADDCPAAPRLTASTTASALPSVVIMRTGIVFHFSLCLIADSSWRPSIPGILMSVSTMSTDRIANMANASSPLLASQTSAISNSACRRQR